MVSAAKNIPVQDQTVKRLLRIAESFEETADSVINRLLDFHERHHNRSNSGPDSQDLAASQSVAWSPFDPPRLRHTKVLAAAIGGREVSSPSWNRLADEAVRHTQKKLGSFAALKKVTPANIIEGVKRDQGYRYLSDINLSIQGQDAEDAWRCVAQLAKSQGFSVEVHFLWRNNPDAAHPGQIGNLTIGGAE
jgi:hypothetical protein